jgi:import inner membrane translocase subunit TIM8
MDPQTQVDISSLSDADKKELNAVLTNEAQKSNIQQAVHTLNDVCFTKCIRGKPITSGTLDRAEEACAQNCVERWFDTQMSILKHLDVLRGGH